jgi:hypothetical protein
MSRYKMKETDFETPPENVYAIDLVGIDEKEGKRGVYFRWRWVIADIPEQQKFAGAWVTSITPSTPTMNNRFGGFLKVLLKDVQIGTEGDTGELINGKVRVKGFVEHNKTTDKGEEVTYLNVTRLLDNTAQWGVGIGRQDLKDDDSPRGGSAKPAAAGVGQVKAAPSKAVSEEEIPW